ncbi:MAG: hypothetical protein N3A69_12760 [Leptospiraceae bacterium]|nr:hypothetical protein [Leptospiraceae bacterium]
MKLHHIAIGTSNLLDMKNFYARFPISKVIREQFYENGELRSVWFQMSHNVILMLEDRNYKKAPEALIFEFPENYSLEELGNIFQFKEKTEYTVYFYDVDGNKLGFSSFPSKISERFSI